MLERALAAPLAIALGSASARAQSGPAPTLLLDPLERGWIAEHPIVHYTVPFEVRPLLWVEDGRPVGLIPDLLARAAALTGLAFRYRSSSSRDEAFARLRAAELDLVAMVRVDPSRRGELVYTQPFLDSALGLYVRDDTEIRADPVDAFATRPGVRIAVPMGLHSAIANAIDRDEPAWVPVASTEAAIRGLAERRWDGAILPELTANHAVMMVGPGRLRLAGTLPQTVPFAMATTAAGASLASILNAVLRRTHAPEREDLLARWIRPAEPGGSVAVPVVATVAGLTAGLAIGLRLRRIVRD